MCTPRFHRSRPDPWADSAPLARLCSAASHFTTHCDTLAPPPPCPPRRVEKIQAAMAPAVQEKKAADYAKTLPAKLLNKGLLQYIKKSAWEK